MKEIGEIVLESLTTLTLNKLRTGLAILGIVIGIGSVIALISLGQASQKQIQSQIQSLGSNLLTIIPGAQNTGGVRQAAGSTTTLTTEDADAMQQALSTELPDVQSVSPELSSRSQVTAGGNNSNIQVIGVTDTYEPIHNITMDEGTFISATDSQNLSKVAVIGPQVVSDLFPTSDPLGQTIRIDRIAFRVIGVTQSKGGSGFQNPDDIAYIPLQTAQKQIFGEDHLSDISISAKSADSMTAAENEAGYFLLRQHKISDPSQADFSILSQSDILNAASSTTGTFTALLSGIAAISLLVGGIGIMNIMLVTVNERTREIGLRKALGAKKRIITTQFLIESILLTFVGGIIGIVLGIAVSFGFSTVIGLPFTIAGSSILLAFVVSAGIGIIFGWYPASRAANLQPIEALRYE